MATKSKPKKTVRKNIFIRVSDVPEDLYKKIKKNAETSKRTQGNEIIHYLTQTQYK